MVSTYESSVKIFKKLRKKRLAISNSYYIVVITILMKKRCKTVDEEKLKTFCCALLPGG